MNKIPPAARRMAEAASDLDYATLMVAAYREVLRSDTTIPPATKRRVDRRLQTLNRAVFVAYAMVGTREVART